MENISKKEAHIYVISGGKGVASDAVAQAVIAQFPDTKISIRLFPDIINEELLNEALYQSKQQNAIVLHSFVDKKLRDNAQKYCFKEHIRNIDVFGGLTDHLSAVLDVEPLSVPGLYRKLHQEYFDRMDALEYTLSVDDGVTPEYLNKADIILAGVSRSGKTPLSLYLAMRGWKVSNIPLVHGITPPDELFAVDKSRVFGLVINLNNLIAQRHRRLEKMGNFESENYVETRKVAEELEFARRIYDKGGFTEINITNKPIETTANEIIGFINERFSPEERRKKY